MPLLVAQYVYWKSIAGELRQNNADKALEFYRKLKARTAPAPETCALILILLGKQNRVEMAMKEHDEAVSLGMPRHHLTHSALIYACSKRRAFYLRAIDLLHQMDVHGMPVDLRVYNNLLVACAKTSDMPTAVVLWEHVERLALIDAAFCPNEHTVCNFLWALAAVETPENKISKRGFCYPSEAGKEIVGRAMQVLHRAQSDYGVHVNSHVLTAYLAVATNHLQSELAERVFGMEFDKRGIPKPALAYEVMFMMYDRLQAYPQMLEVKKELEQRKDVVLGKEGWRAAVRCAALTDHLSEAVLFLRQMRAAGYEATPSEVRALHLRIFEHERWDLHEQLLGLVKWPEKPDSPNPMMAWRERSQRIHALLERIYGAEHAKEVPKLSR